MNLSLRPNGYSPKSGRPTGIRLDLPAALLRKLGKPGALVRVEWSTRAKALIIRSKGREAKRNGKG